MNGKIWLRIFAALVMVAAIAGIAFFAYNAGMAHGSPVTLQSPSGQTVPAPYAYGYGYGMPWHPFFGFGCFAPLILLFLFFLAMKSFRMMAFGPRWGFGGPMMHGHGPWRRDWGERGIPPMVEEWHKRMHGESTSEKKEG